MKNLVKRTSTSIIFVFVICIVAKGQTWSAVGNGVNGSVNSFAIYNGELYVGGQFNNPGGITPNGILKWNGSSFDTLPGSYLLGSCNIRAMIVYKNELYVGGGFSIGSSPFSSIYNFIARWNGSIWSSVGSGFNNIVCSMAVYKDNLYVGGFMDFAGSTVVNQIAKWDGFQWSAVANGIPGSAANVLALEVYKDELYAGGEFYLTTANAAYIARWNDTVWKSVGTGYLNHVVYSLSTFNDDLFVGGSSYFTMAGNIPVNQIAKWDGTTWASVGAGTGNDFSILYTLKEYNNELYVGGEFGSMDGDSIKGIARYNGISWDSLGSGVDSTNIIRDTLFDFPYFGDTMYNYAPHTVNALQVFNNELYVGGSFNMIGGINAKSIAKWHVDGASVNEQKKKLIFSVFPIPATDELNIIFETKENEDIKISIYNILGQNVYNEKLEASKGTNIRKINIAKYATGVYIVNVSTKDGNISRKIIKK